MVNIFGWRLDIISHSDTKTVEKASDNKKRKSTATGSAHYYGNWNKEKQDKYNAWYYQNNKDKWGVKDSSTSTESIGDGDSQCYIEKDKDGKESLYLEDEKIASGDELKNLDKKKAASYVNKKYKELAAEKKKKGIKDYSKAATELNKKYASEIKKGLKALVSGKDTDESSSSSSSKKSSSKKSSGSSKKSSGSGSSKKSSGSSSKSSGSGSKKSGSKLKGGTGKSASSGSSKSGSGSSKSSSGSSTSSKSSSGSDSSKNKTAYTQPASESATQSPLPPTDQKGTEIGGTGFFESKDSSGKSVITIGDTKFTLPAGRTVDEQLKTNLKMLNTDLAYLKKNGTNYGKAFLNKAAQLTIDGKMKELSELFNEARDKSIKHFDHMLHDRGNNYSWDLDFISHAQNDPHQYGIPQQKKFPLDSRAHVISAIKFFNYASPVYRRQLASAIIRKIHEYGIKVDAPSGSDNLFYRYYKGGER